MQGFSPKISSLPAEFGKTRLRVEKRGWHLIRHLPNIAMTTSSFNISIEPRAIKYRYVRTSPLCSSVSPGGAWVVLNFNESALKKKGKGNHNVVKNSESERGFTLSSQDWLLRRRSNC